MSRIGGGQPQEDAPSESQDRRRARAPEDNNKELAKKKRKIDDLESSSLFGLLLSVDKTNQQAVSDAGEAKDKNIAATAPLSSKFKTNLLREYGISSRTTPIVPMQPTQVPWRNMEVDDLVASFIAKFPSMLTSNDEDRPRVWNELETEILNAVVDGLSIDDFHSVLPDLVSAGSWRTARIVSATSLIDKNSEQDYTAQVYAQYFEPFLVDLNHQACTNMILPPPFEKNRRKPDTRAFVNSALKEFVFFLREDTPVRTDNDTDVHKDLFNLVQLMRFALRLQTLMLSPSHKGQRTLYCFGIVSSGLKFRLLQMSVVLKTEQDYTSPKFMLYIDNGLLDLNFAQVDMDEKRARLTKLLNWLSVIRSYGFHLKKLLESGEWQLNTELLECKTTAKTGVVYESAKNKEGDNNEQIQEKNTEVNDAILAAIVQAIEDKRYRVLHEDGGSDKRVVAVGIFIDRIRVFAVKIFGVESRKRSREVEVMKLLGKHPHLSEILASTTLKTGELIVVQPYYPPSYDLLGYEEYCQVFLHLAKGLEHIHERGVIHGDIKPANLITTKDRYTRIIDFDFSLRMGIDGWDQFVGTSGYRAPETFDKKNNKLTPKIDIWSLAMTMCRSFGSLADELDPLKKHQILLEQLRFNVYLAPLRVLLEKMIELNPHDRPTARQVRQAIELAMQGKDYAHVLIAEPASVPVPTESANKENEVVMKSAVGVNKSPTKHRARASPLKDISNLAK